MIRLLIFSAFLLGSTYAVLYQCECAFYAEDTFQDKMLYENLTDPSPVDRSDCTTLNDECRGFCASSHDSWWQYNDLTTRTPGQDGILIGFGDLFCKEYGNVIDPATSGEPIFTKYRVPDCSIDWTRTSNNQVGAQNLCCERRIVELFYRECTLPPLA